LRPKQETFCKAVISANLVNTSNRKGIRDIGTNLFLCRVTADVVAGKSRDQSIPVTAFVTLMI
jgi:hypothetical protein